MNINIDDQIKLGWVYKVSIKLTQPIGKTNGKIEHSFETTFNLKQPERAINRAIQKCKMDKELVNNVEVKMLEQLTLSCF